MITARTTCALAASLALACLGAGTASAFAPAQPLLRARSGLGATGGDGEGGGTALAPEAALEAAPEAVNPRKVGLSLMLDDGTRKSHSMAENTAFVSGFFKGIGTRDAFAELVTSLYFVYAAMEQEFSAATDAGVRALDYPELRRVGALERDMEYFYGTEWRDTIRPSPAARRYVSRIREVAGPGGDPALLIAHQYTRYLGDLFGGQMMGGMATRSLGLEAGRGTSFYEFSEIPDTQAFIDEWYRALNELDLTEEQQQAIVDEANLVFALNIEIFEELDGSPLQAMLMLVVNSLKEKLGF